MTFGVKTTVLPPSLPKKNKAARQSLVDFLRLLRVDTKLYGIPTYLVPNFGKGGIGRLGQAGKGQTPLADWPSLATFGARKRGWAGPARDKLS